MIIMMSSPLNVPFTVPRPNPAVPGAAPGPAPGAPGVTMPGPGGQTPHGSFVPGEQQVIIMRTGHLLTYVSGNNYSRLPGQTRGFDGQGGQQSLQVTDRVLY